MLPVLWALSLLSLADGPASANELPAALTVHTRLVSSAPAADDTLAESPTRVYLLFSAAVNPSLSAITVSGAEGELKLPVSGDPENDRALLAEVPGLRSGQYVVRWRTVSADGHPVEGSYSFVLSLPEPAPPAEAPDTIFPAAPEAENGPQATSEGEGDGELEALPGIIRGLGGGLLMAFAGLTVFLGWLAPTASQEPRRLAVALGAAAPAALTAHLLVWIASIGPQGMNMGAVQAGLATRVGELEALRIVLGLSAFAALVFLKSLKLAAGLSSVAVILGGALGHAASFQPALSIPVKSVHLVGGALWFGGLLLLVSDRGGGAEYSARAATVSKVALAAVIAITLTGLLQTLLISRDVGALLGSVYGGFIMAKLVGLGVLISIGAHNRFKLLPSLAESGDPSELRASVRRESAVLFAVILVAGILARISPP